MLVSMPDKTVVEKIHTPPDARALCSLSRIDYEDAFRARTNHARELSAEEWARRFLERAPVPFRLGAPFAWFGLGLRHRRPWDEAGVLGWPVLRNKPDLILLGAESRTGMPAQLLLRREVRSILFATFIQHRNGVMRGVWRPIAAPHQRVVARLLARAVSEEWAILDSNQGPRPYQRRALTD
jgi:hypothetical protein